MRRHLITAVAVAGFVLGPGGAVAGAQPGVNTNPHANQASQAGHSLRDTDPRSPDARDAAETLVVPPGVIAKSKPVSVAKADDGGGGGIDVVDAGVGAGLAVLLALGAAQSVRHRRGAARPA